MFVCSIVLNTMALFCDIFVHASLTLLIISTGKSGGEKYDKNTQSSSGIDNLSKYQLSKLVDELLSKANGNNPQGELQQCQNQFTVESDKIIRTRDSLDNGAKFLVAVPHIQSADACFHKCCKYKNADSSLQCDLSVFQQLSGERDEPQCFLFDCINEQRGDHKFVCLFSEHSGYSAYKRLVFAKESTEMPPTTAVYEQTGTDILMKTVLPDTFQSYPVSLYSVKNCSKFEWKCDNGLCITIFSVCNQVPDCSDFSDERDCPAEAWVGTANEKTKDFSTTTTKTMSHVHTTSTNAATSAHHTELTSINVDDNINNRNIGTVHPERGALLPLALGLAVTLCVLVMVVCRLKIMKKKISRKPGPLLMDESDYLINGMYL